MDGSKTVTRRLGSWWAETLRPGDRLCGVRKSQGIKRGELHRLRVVEVVSVRVEPLWAIYTPSAGYDPDGRDEVAREGFPGMTAEDFALMFGRHMGCNGYASVSRIEFKYPPPLTPGWSRCPPDAPCDESKHWSGLCACQCHGDRRFS